MGTLYYSATVLQIQNYSKTKVYLKIEKMKAFNVIFQEVKKVRYRTLCDIEEAI